MRLTSKRERRIAILLSAFMGAAAFILIYGYHILIPTYTDWLMVYGAGDPQQHYLGWRFFQQSSWHFPIGMMDTLGYPILTSVVFTDSIPLFAILFKLLTPILPAEFQYFGLWGILCFTLQGALGAVICLKYARRPVQAILGSLLFILSPAVLNRMYYHSALAGHWIILVGLAFLVYHSTLTRWQLRSFVLWGLLGGLIAGVHLYFLPMCGILCLGYCAYDMIKNKRWYGFLPIVSFIACAVGVSWVLGAFTSSAGASMEGLGEYSFNLNGFVNPMWASYSSILQTLPSFDLQHEGFAYLGFGVLSLCAVSFLLLVDGYLAKEGSHALREAVHRRRLDLAIYGVMALLFVIVAVSPVVTFNGHVLFQIPLPQQLLALWGIFRSTGRLIWPLGYIMIFAAAALVTRKQERRFAIMLLALCVGLQAYDLHGRMNNLRAEYSRRVAYDNPLSESFWFELGEDDRIAHLVTDNALGDFLYPVADIALQNHWTLNNFYFARSVDGIWNTLENALKAPDDTMLFALRPETFEAMMTLADPSLSFYELDGLIIGTTQKERIALPALALRYVYSIGDGAFLRGGEDVDGVRYVHPEGLSYGPYWRLKPGIYEVHMSGANLDQAEVICAKDGANTRLDRYDYAANAEELSFKIQLFEAVEDLEILVSAMAADTISFDTLTATYLSDNEEILADDPARSFVPLAYHYPFAGNLNVRNGEDIDGARHIHTNGISYGPYLNVPAGLYEIRITGTNLDAAGFDCVTDGGEVVFALLDLHVTETEVTYRVELADKASSLETRVYNDANETVILTSLTIVSISADGQ